MRSYRPQAIPDPDLAPNDNATASTSTGANEKENASFQRHYGSWAQKNARPMKLHAAKVFAAAQRTDRALNALRPIFMRSNIIAGAAGSAYVEAQHTKLCCAIYGPRQSKRTVYSDEARIWCEVKYAPFVHTSSLSSTNSATKTNISRQFEMNERKIVNALTDTFSSCINRQRYPKSVIEIYIFILEDDGGVLSAAINATTLALSNAAIEMYDLPASATVHCFNPQPKKSDIIYAIDCTLEESASSNCTGSLTLAYSPSTDDIIYLSQSGTLTHPDSLKQLMDAAIEGALVSQQGIKQAIKASFPSKDPT